MQVSCCVPFKLKQQVPHKDKATPHKAHFKASLPKSWLPFRPSVGADIQKCAQLNMGLAEVGSPPKSKWLASKRHSYV